MASIRAPVMARGMDEGSATSISSVSLGVSAPAKLKDAKAASAGAVKPAAEVELISEVIK